MEVGGDCVQDAASPDITTIVSLFEPASVLISVVADPRDQAHQNLLEMMSREQWGDRTRLTSVAGFGSCDDSTTSSTVLRANYLAATPNSEQWCAQHADKTRVWAYSAYRKPQYIRQQQERLNLQVGQGVESQCPGLAGEGRRTDIDDDKSPEKPILPGDVNCVEILEQCGGHLLPAGVTVPDLLRAALPAPEGAGVASGETSLSRSSSSRSAIAEGVLALDDEFATCVVDLACLAQKAREWKRLLPRVHAHYAVKCNPSPVVLRTLMALGLGFDCASKVSRCLSLSLSSSSLFTLN
jgi:hypothetical protein